MFKDLLEAVRQGKLASSNHCLPCFFSLIIAIALFSSACDTATQRSLTSPPTLSPPPPIHVQSNQGNFVNQNPGGIPTSPPATTPNQQQNTGNTSVLVEASVIRVIDGDTIEVGINGSIYTVRYIGMDTPETVNPSKPVEYFGREASDKNKELVAGKTVRLEKDVSETDKYGRLLRYVYVGKLFVNAELVRLGYAQVATYPPDVKYTDLFLRLQTEAREAGRGLWETTVAPTPTSPPNVEVPLRIISVTSPARVGSKASLVAETNPGAMCSITVYYKSGPSSAAGLESKVADTSGRVSWTWTVGSRTTPGTWRIVVATGTINAETTFTVQ